MFSTSKPPLTYVPKSGNPKCYFRVSGGLGDVLICAGIVSGIPNSTLAVPKNHFKLLSNSLGIDRVVRISDRPNYSEFDVVSNFDGIFANFVNLVDSNYYDVAANHVKVGVKLLKLNLPKEQGFDYVIHPSSSNPNRDWGKSNYLDLANSLAESGKTVAFLGTKLEPGFTSKNVTKLSDISEDLTWQASVLENSKYFIGNDSGFCHLAGIFGVEGLVLFFNTKPENVIKYYSKLTGVVTGEVTGLLNPLDETSIKNKSALSCQDLCDRLGVAYSPFSGEITLQDLTLVGSGPRFEMFKKHLPGYFNLVSDSNLILDTDTDTIVINNETFVFKGGPYDLSRFITGCEQCA